MDKEEADLSLRSNQILDNARHARQATESCLSQLRVLEKQFSAALDIDRTVPAQLNVTRQLRERTTTLGRAYSGAIAANKEQIQGTEAAQSASYALIAVHGICSLGKLCEAILAILPATEMASEFLKGTKTVLGSTKDFIEAKRMVESGDKGGGSGRSVEAALKLLGEQTSSLADLVGGIVDIRVVSDPHRKDAIDYGKLAEQAASVVKTLKGVMKTLEMTIVALKHETRTSTRMGAVAKVLDVLENLLECYKNAQAAYDDYQDMMASAASIGRTRAHMRSLEGWNGDKTHASRKAFEAAVLNAAANDGKLQLKDHMIRFSRNIRSEAEAEVWADDLSSYLESLTRDLQHAQKRLTLYAKNYGVLLDKLAESRPPLDAHKDKLYDSYDEIAAYEKGLGHRSSLLAHMPSNIANELTKLDDAVTKADIRLAISADMSKTRLTRKIG